MKLKENKVKSLVNKTLNSLIESIEKGQSDTLQNYLKAMGRFHSYSFMNIMLISRQSPNATKVAGFHTWKKQNRFILKGEKGIKIIAPIRSKKESLNVSKEEDEIFGFRVVHVFDISQTDGEDLPDISKVKGDPAKYSNKLNKIITECNIELEYSDNISAYGYSIGGKIVIRSGLSPAEDFSVRVHELTHELLHKDKREKWSKKLKETEAEAVAYVVCHEIGLNINTASQDYIQLYNGDRETLLLSFNRIQRTSSEILCKLKSSTIKIES